MVIQEAFVNGRPPVVSDIGGMAEKVRHGEDGFLVTAGSSTQWASTLLELSSMNDPAWLAQQSRIKAPATNSYAASTHVALFA